MSTAWTSLLPFLAALQRNQNTPEDDDDSNPPVDQFGRVLPSQGNGVAPGASQNNLAQTDALQNYQMAPGTPPLLMQLLQAGVYPSPPKPGGPGTPRPSPPTPGGPGTPRPSPPTPGGPGTPQSSDPKQAQATDDNDDSKPPVGPSGLVGVVSGASQSNMQSNAIGDIVRSMKPGALPVYPPLQQAGAMSSEPNPNFVRPANVEAERQAALERGQATQPPVSDAQRQAGLVIRVGKRPLYGDWPKDRYYHTYLEIPRLDENGHPVYDTNGNVVYDSYGVLGQWNDKKQDGTRKNQQVIKDDRHVQGQDFQLRNEPKDDSQRNALYEIAVSPDQLAYLRAGAEHWSQWQNTGDKCPSCGKDYVLGNPLIDNDGYNSNTWVYNMLIHNPAGRIEPPAAIDKDKDNGLAPGWKVNDLSKDYYPARPPGAAR